jgi:hypothetical protein
MPLSIQIPYRGDEYLFQGVAGAGARIGKGLEEMAQRQKQVKAYRTMAVDGLGMDPEEVDHMSFGELQGHLQAVTVKHAMESAQAMQAERFARAQRLQEATAMEQAMKGFAQDYTAPDQAGNGASAAGVEAAQWAGGDEGAAEAAGAVPSMTAEQRFYRALKNNPLAASSPQFDNTLNSLAKVAGIGGKKAFGTPGAVTEIPGMPNHRFIWQTESSGTAVPVGAGSGTTKTEEIPGTEEGTVLVTDPAGRSHVVKPSRPAADPMMQISIDSKQKALAQLVGDMTVLQAQIDKGGGSTGKTLGMFGKNLQEQMEQKQQEYARLQAELQALTGGSGKKLQGAAPAPGRGTRPTGNETNAVPNGASFNDFTKWLNSQK